MTLVRSFHLWLVKLGMITSLTLVVAFLARLRGDPARLPPGRWSAGSAEVHGQTPQKGGLRMGQPLQSGESVEVCEFDGECQEPAIALLTLTAAVFRSDWMPRELCREHTLQEMRRAQRMGYAPLVESLDQLALF